MQPDEDSRFYRLQQAYRKERRGKSAGAVQRPCWPSIPGIASPQALKTGTLNTQSDWLKFAKAEALRGPSTAGPQ